MATASGADRKPRALLLNPPHRLRVARDCYCSQIVKARYCWHPLDLLVQAALLRREADVLLIDAIAEGLGERAVVERTLAWRPDWVFGLVGAAVAEDDLAFYRRLRAALPGSRLVVGGDLFTDPDAGAPDPLVFDGALVEFVSPALAQWVGGATPEHDLFVPADGFMTRLPLSKARSFSHPPTPPGLFDRRLYALPFFGAAPFYSLLASYGCPYGCRFCHVPSLGYKSRDPEETFEEIREAVRRGFSNIYLRDATFGIRREDALALCRKMAGLSPRVRWNCFARADLLDDELLSAMAASGCAVVQIGAETMDALAAQGVDKTVDPAGIERVIAACRRLGILTSLHFVLGLPGDRWAESAGAASDMIRIDPDYVSLNVLESRPGTALHRDGVALSDPDARRLRRVARRLNLRFYLRPRRVLAELARLRNPRQLFRALWMFLSLVRPGSR